jgi:hypothetical protein
MSSEKLRQALSSGAIQEAGIQPTDPKRADQLLGGLSEEILKGKSKKRAARVQNLEESLNEGELVLYMDILKTGGSYYLLSVCSPGKYAIAHPLGNTEARAVKNLRAPVLEQISSYKPFGYTVATLSVDGEGAIKKLEKEIVKEGTRVVTRT